MEIKRQIILDESDWGRAATVAATYDPPTRRPDILKLAIRVGLDKLEEAQQE